MATEKIVLAYHRSFRWIDKTIIHNFDYFFAPYFYIQFLRIVNLSTIYVLRLKLRLHIFIMPWMGQLHILTGPTTTTSRGRVTWWQILIAWSHHVLPSCRERSLKILASWFQMRHASNLFSWNASIEYCRCNLILLYLRVTLWKIHLRNFRLVRLPVTIPTNDDTYCSKMPAFDNDNVYLVPMTTNRCFEFWRHPPCLLGWNWAT